MPSSYVLDEGSQARRGRVKRDNDVFVLVKEYISSTELRQAPMLALTAESAASYALTTQRSLAKSWHTLFQPPDVSSNVLGLVTFQFF